MGGDDYYVQASSYGGLGRIVAREGSAAGVRSWGVGDSDRNENLATHTRRHDLTEATGLTSLS